MIKKPNKGTRLRRIAATVLAGMALWGGLTLWTASAEGASHYRPTYEKEDLSPIVVKMEHHEPDEVVLTEKEWESLFYQTGLGPSAVRELWMKGQQEELFRYQEDFFKEVTVTCSRSRCLISSEYLTAEQQDAASGEMRKVKIPRLASLREGDILITPCSHCFGFRHGHAAIAVEVTEEGGRTLESVTMGVNSQLRSVERWRSYPAFAVLRLREEAAEKDGGSEAVGRCAAQLAKDCFCDIPYRLSAGLWGDAEETELSGTQCAHMVWCCYHALGYDLDSDGGRLVTPRDVLESPLLEVVQVYGMDPETVLKNHENFGIKNDKKL